MMYRLLSLLTGLGLSMVDAAAQTVYRAGDPVENFSLIDRRTGQPRSLAEFAGKILFLDFFAYWCPVCAAAAPQLETGVYERYRAAGNAVGLPVVYVLCNLQGDFTARDRAGTDAFLSRFGPDVVVLQDNNRALQRRFTSAAGQPTFAVINGVKNSPSHRPWELVFSLHGYTSPGRVQPVLEFQAAIDSVQAPPALSIITQPEPRIVPVGAEVIFSAAAAGSEPIRFQWWKDGASIEGATEAALHLSDVQVSDAGSYRVVVTNPDGQATSDTALLTVIEPVMIITQPVGGMFTAGATVTLEVEARGAAPLTYQWKRDGLELPEMTGPTLRLHNLQSSDAGDYRVVVTNPAGSVTSALAVVAVGAGEEAPVFLTRFRHTAEGVFEFHIERGAGRSYRVEFSNDLQQWNTLTVVPAGVMSQVVRDPGASGAAVRYYRLVSQ